MFLVERFGRMSHDWELSKENVIPVKKGRSVQDCGPLKPSHGSELTFETTLQQNVDNAEGLLSAYIQYYTWIRRRAGDNKASAKALLEVSSPLLPLLLPLPSSIELFSTALHK